VSSSSYDVTFQYVISYFKFNHEKMLFLRRMSDEKSCLSFVVLTTELNNLTLGRIGF